MRFYWIGSVVAPIQCYERLTLFSRKTTLSGKKVKIKKRRPMFNQGRIEPENFESEPTRVQKFSSPSRARAPKIFRTIMEKQIIYESMGNEMTKDF